MLSDFPNLQKTRSCIVHAILDDMAVSGGKENELPFTWNDEIRADYMRQFEKAGVGADVAFTEDFPEPKDGSDPSKRRGIRFGKGMAARYALS